MPKTSHKCRKCKKSRKFCKKVLTLNVEFVILLMHSTKKAKKANKKSAKKSKKVVDKASRKCYTGYTRCKKGNVEMIFEN